MATRSRRSAAAEAVVEEEEEQDAVSSLQFNQTLIGRPGKPIAIAELLTRLQTLSDELQNLDQEDVPREALEPVARELAHHSLLSHKDAGVRAWTASCLVEMFRLCAPDAPYTASQLKEIFTLIITRIIHHLADPSNTYNSEHLHVLKSLAEIKSIVLLADIPNTGALTSTLFTTCFDVLSGGSKASNGEELSKNVEHHMTAILSTLIDESPQVPTDVTDVILAQFLRADLTTLTTGGKAKKNAPVDLTQSTLLLKEAPPPYNMAKNICNACPDKMARAIGSYFSSVIVDATSVAIPKNRGRHRAGSDAADSEDEIGKGPSEEDLQEAGKAHRLLRELWRCCPGVLQEIIPHLQDELSAENVHLRQMATETFGDMISGIGAAGPPPMPSLNPVAYPSQSLSPSKEHLRVYNFLTTPTSLSSFSVQHPAAYASYLQRKQDKSPVIRAVWTTGLGRILMTSAGGVGLEPEEETKLLRYFAETLIDSDERVRLAAIKAIEYFEFTDIVQKLGSIGGVGESGSLLSNLADRVKDKKNVVRAESMKLLGKVWGVASGAIAEGDERISTLLGLIPSRILDACYVNDAEVNVQVDLTMFEALFPLGYPPIKAKAAANGASQPKNSQANKEQNYTESELDKLRVERMLVLVRGLEEKAKKVFVAKQGNQAAGAKYMESFLKICEDYNGGVVEKDEKKTKEGLSYFINFYSKTMPEPSRVGEDLWKFAKAHDRRSYQLIRFCMAPDSDYKKVFRSIKELRKRIEESPASATMVDTLIPLVYRASLLCYNKSHLPAIIEYSRTDEKGLGSTAHEILKEISTKHPKVFSAHVQELCKAIEAEAPTATEPNGPGAVDDLKACSSFAKKYPKELPNERKFIQSLLNYTFYGSPPKAAKHAVTILLSGTDKKELHVKNILKRSLKFENGGPHYLTKLAAIGQLVLLAPKECEDDTDAIADIAINQILLKPHTTSEETEGEWMETPDDDMVARTLAIKILVNRLRSFPATDNVREVAGPIYKLLNTMVREGGETSKKHNTPLAHKNLQRVLAGTLLLKLSESKRYDLILTARDFNHLAIVCQDPCYRVREAFVSKLLKYLGHNRLASTRYYIILFLLAFEPDVALQESVVTWLKARRFKFNQARDTTLECAFPRLLSLLAHHPDFDTDPESLQMMTQYIIFYLKTIATAENISLIFATAQRVKSIADGITPGRAADDKLYVLSDLSQAVIRLWEEANGWSIQAWAGGKLPMPSGIFRPLESHQRAQEIADKVYVDEELVEDLEPYVRQALRSKKRKAGDEAAKEKRKKIRMEKAEKKAKEKSERKVKTPKKRRRTGEDGDDDESDAAPRRISDLVAPSSGARRRSGRAVAGRSYVEVSDEDEVDEDAEEEEEEEDEQEEPAEEDDEASEDNDQASNVEVEQEDVDMIEAPPANDPISDLSEPEADVPEAEAEPEAKEASDQASSPPPEPSPPKRRTRGKMTRANAWAMREHKMRLNGMAKPASPQNEKNVTPAKGSSSVTATKTPPSSAKKVDGGKLAGPGTKGRGRRAAAVEGVEKEKEKGKEKELPMRRSTRARG